MGKRLIEGLSVTSKSSINILDIANKIITSSNTITDDQKISQFLKHLTITEAEKVNVEKITRKQTDCAAWKEFRKGRLTESNHHTTIFAKINYRK